MAEIRSHPHQAEIFSQLHGEFQPSLRADVSYFLPPAEKGRLRNGVANRVPVSCCFSGIRGKCLYWLLDNSHC